MEGASKDGSDVEAEGGGSGPLASSAARRPERLARAGGLTRGGRAYRPRAQGWPAIPSVRASSQLPGRRLVATALVVVAAVGAGVLLRGRMTTPRAEPPASAPTDQRPAAEVSGAPGEPATPVEVRTPTAAEPAPTAEPLAEVTAPGLPRGRLPEPTAEPIPTTEVPLPTAVPPEVVAPVAPESMQQPEVVATGVPESMQQPEVVAPVAPESVEQPATAEPTESEPAPPAEPPPAEPPPAPPPPRPARAPAPPPPPPARPRAVTRTYTVQRGDLLKQIAARYGVSIASILAINDIPDPDSLRVGQVLVIPPAP